MGEQSKYLGDLGEDFFAKLIEKLGWTKACDWNFDFPCEDKDHKTEKKAGEKQTHGIDGVYAYVDPYDRIKTHIIVDSKAISWVQKNGTTKNTSPLIKQLSGYREDLDEKIQCAIRSEDFRKTTGLGTEAFKTFGLLCCYVHKGFSLETQGAVIAGSKFPKTGSNSQIFVLSMEMIEQILTMISFLEGNVGKYSFYYPDLDKPDKKPPNPWEPFLTIESLFSSFIVAANAGDESKGERFVFYKGDLSHDGLTRLFCGLGRIQLFNSKSITLVPIRALDTKNDRHAISAIVDKNNEIQVEGRDVKVKWAQPSLIRAQFELRSK